VKQTITEYLFNYVLNNVCGGNKSDFARRIDMRRPDLIRLGQRIADGAISARAMESIIDLLRRENLSFDEVMKDYYADIEPDAVHFDSPTRILREKLLDEWQNANKRMDVFKEAESFMGELESTFCSEECRANYKCGDDCPCARFYEYMSWLKGEMEKSA